jgi:hypothetical protein
MGRRLSLPHRVAAAVALIAALAVTARPARAQDVGLQVELSVSLLELSVAEWRERNSVPADDQAARGAALVTIEKKFEGERAQLYRKYFTTAADHLAFFGQHTSDVEEYLAENPDVDGRIKALHQTLRALIGIEEVQPETTPGAER